MMSSSTLIKKTQRKKRGKRKGYTTGACAAAAARAATIALVTGVLPEKVTCCLANGQNIEFVIRGGFSQSKHAQAMVIKDAGDDPDVTDKAHITVDLYLCDQPIGKINFKQGKGVGIVIRQGLGLEVNGPAINPVPRKNIRENIQAVADNLLMNYAIDVVVSVPGGEIMAKRTLNSRLGIIGGISILGTTGIVHPWSTAAFRSSVKQAVEVTAKQGEQTIVLTTGGRSEKFVIAELPELAEVCFVQMGDFLKVALDSCIEHGIKHIVIGAMVGKLAKMAQGENITHARKNPVNMQLVAKLAAKAGAPESIVNDISLANTARYASERMQEIGLIEQFYLQLAHQVMATLLNKYQYQFSLKIMICDFEGIKRLELDSQTLHPAIKDL